MNMLLLRDTDERRVHRGRLLLIVDGSPPRIIPQSLPCNEDARRVILLPRRRILLVLAAAPFRIELAPPFFRYDRIPRIHGGRRPLRISEVKLGLSRRRCTERVHPLVVVYAREALDQTVLRFVQLLHPRHRLLGGEELPVAFDLGLLGQSPALRGCIRDDAHLLLEALELFRLESVEARLFVISITLPF